MGCQLDSVRMAVQSRTVSYASAEMALRSLPTVFALIASLSAAAIERSQEPVADEGLLAQVRTASQFEGAPQVGRLIGWTEDGPRLQSGQVPADWVEMSFPLSSASTAQPEEPGWVLELADGLRVPGTPRGGSADQVDWAVGSGAELLLLPVDLLMVRGFGRARVPIAVGDQKEDLLALRTSTGLDRRSGWLEEINKDGIIFSIGDRVEAHAWEKVEGLRLFEEQMLIPVVQDQVLVRLRDGGVLPFVPESLREGRWGGGLPWGGKLELEAEWVAGFERMGGPFLDLTRLRPDAVSFESGQVLDWAPRLHLSVSGRVLRVGEGRYAWGFGVRAPTTIGWQLPGPGLLTVEYGVDQEVAGHRDPSPLRFQVLLDDELLIERTEVTRESGLGVLCVQIPRAGKLQLRCLSEGESGASGRHGDWIAPRYWPSEGRL